MTKLTSKSPKLVGGAVAGGALLLVLAACGLQSSSSAAIGATGGTVTLESGLSLSVPAGALSKPELVTLREARAEAADQVEVEPSGATLSSPAVLSWSDDGRTEAVESEDGGMLPVHRQCGRAHVHVRHFGRFRCHHGGGDGGVRHGGADGGSRDGHGGGEGHGGGDGHGGRDGHGGGDDGHADGGSDDHGDHHDGDDDDEDRDADDQRFDGGCPAQRPDAGTVVSDGGLN